MQIKADYTQQFDTKRGLVFVPGLIIDGTKTSIKNAQQYDTKSEAISEAESVIKRHHEDKNPLQKTVEDQRDFNEPNEKAAASLRVKMESIRLTIDTMTDAQYGDWIESLEFDEFLELASLSSKYQD
ncbi:hypothetical protein AB6E94_19255 [Vibrio lentus]|uniref:hypothetical protein n=1 Tax=Vibrio splendidus TaxID=29497 RepID=UPI000C85E5E2|nr:hypothetical protein [Vibrio splendidus]PMG17839.1 hypothetical protein BCU98_00470 [Vibrio splendidus]